ncbi:MAG: hypothetical protein KDA28_17560, partial [Phycisphaerales bacterium]|nr:hypothetical protein [Phycisphaerales bacterium]
GREYEFNNDPRFRAEMEEVEKAGGRVVFSSGDVVFSSTALIEAMEHAVDPYHQRIASLVRRDELRGDLLTDCIAGLRNSTVVVVGEVIRDTYVLCDRPEVASESPVMTLRPLESRMYDGGAAIIARHLAAMGARPILVTALGSSPYAREMRSRLVSEGIQVRDIHIDQGVPEKQRFLVGAQKVMKVDHVEQMVLDARQQDDFVALAQAAAQDATDGAIIADFGLGLLSAPLVQRLAAAMRPHVRILAGDVSGRRAALRSMHDMDLLCPSEEEIRTAFRMYQEGLPAVVWKLMEETRTRRVMVTMASEGLIDFQPREGGSGKGWQSRLLSEHIPALNPIAIDALGCGDAMLAASTLALCHGQPLLTSAFVGAVAAGLESQRVGNVPISARDLRRGVARVRDLHLAYVIPEVIPPRPGTPRRIAS